MTYGFELRAEHNLVHLVQILPIAFSARYKKEIFPSFGKRDPDWQNLQDTADGEHSTVATESKVWV